jgi:DNA helicase-2/ATP-dependent DNA helicase PcrA
MACGSAEGVEEERRLLYVALTRARQRLALYVPVRYYHRPKGVDDAHGYGKASRFLTAEVQATCEVMTPDEGQAAAAAGFEKPRRKIEVSVDDLFR